MGNTPHEGTSGSGAEVDVDDGVYAAIDNDNNEKVDLTDYSNEQKAMLRSQFDAYDQGRAGVISTVSLANILGEFGVSGDVSLNDVIDQADPTSSGKINFNRFVAALTTNIAPLKAMQFGKYDSENKPQMELGSMGTLVVRAVAVHRGMCSSEVVDAYLMPEQVEEPHVRFDFDTGLLFFTCATLDATVHYTIDDATPDESSRVVVDTEDAMLTNTKAHTTTVKCVAYKQGMVPSNVRFQLVEVKQVTNPKFSPSVSDSILTNPWVVLSCTTDDVEIKYLLSEMAPADAQNFIPPSADELVTLYSGDKLHVLPTLETSIVVSSVAFKDGCIPSEVVKCAYHATSCKSPEISQLSDGYLAMTCRTKNAAIYFTLDGTEPTKDSRVYSSDANVQVDTTTTETQVVKAFAVREGLIDSSMEELVITFNQVARPVITQHKQNMDMFEISCATNGAVVTYMQEFVEAAFFDDDEDIIAFNDQQTMPYRSSITLDRSAAGVWQIQAKATKYEMVDSVVSSYTVTVLQVRA